VLNKCLCCSFWGYNKSVFVTRHAYGDKTFGASGTSGVGRVAPSVSPSLDPIGAKKKAPTLFGPVAFLIDAAKLCVCVCACSCVCV